VDIGRELSVAITYTFTCSDWFVLASYSTTTDMYLRMYYIPVRRRESCVLPCDIRSAGTSGFHYLHFK